MADNCPYSGGGMDAELWEFAMYPEGTLKPETRAELQPFLRGEMPKTITPEHPITRLFMAYWMRRHQSPLEAFKLHEAGKVQKY